MRFTVADLDRAFEAIGYPPETGKEASIVFAGRVTDFLIDDIQRAVLARRLLCIMSDYVADGRHLDAWIIQHNSRLLEEPPEGGCSPFLLCMFVEGLRQWREARDQEECMLMERLGFDLDEMRQKRSAGLDSALSGLSVTEEMLAETEGFLAEHPRLAAQIQERCRAAEDAALELLRTDDGQSLLLDDEEVQPWLTLFEERLNAEPAILESFGKQATPSKEVKQRFADVMYGTSAEMASEIFTASRLRRLQADANALHNRLQKQGKDVRLAFTGIAMATGTSVPPNESHFLMMLCSHSVMRSCTS